MNFMDCVELRGVAPLHPGGLVAGRGGGNHCGRVKKSQSRCCAVTQLAQAGVSRCGVRRSRWKEITEKMNG